MEYRVSIDGGTERFECARNRRGLERRRSIVRGRRRNGAPVPYRGLQVRMEVTALLLILVPRGTMLRRGPELSGNAGGGAGRVHQQGYDEQERHEPFYFSGRVRIGL